MNDLDRKLQEARADADTAVAHVAIPSFAEPESSLMRRLSVAVAAAAVLLLIIGGSTLWVRSQQPPNPAVAEPTQTTATTPQESTPIGPDAAGRSYAVLLERLREVSLDIRTMQSAPQTVDPAALASRHESIVALAEAENADEARMRMEDLAAEVGTIEAMVAAINAELAGLEGIRDEVAARLNEESGPEELETLGELLAEAEGRIDLIRAQRDQLTRLAEELESNMAAVYVTVAPPAPADEITITHHDYGLRDLAFGGTTFSAIASDGSDLWATTHLILSDPATGGCGECGQLLRIDGASGELIETIELPQPMHYVAAVDGLIWMARTGDGALPDSLVATLNPITLELIVTDIGDTSVYAMAPDGRNGLWLAGSYPASIAYFDGADQAITRSYDVAAETITTLLVVAEAEPELWLGTGDGRVVRISITGEELSSADVGDRVVALNRIAVPSSERGHEVWATTITHASLLDAAGGLAPEQPETQFRATSVPCCTTRPEGSSTVWIATFAGDVFYASPGEGPSLVTTVEYPTTDPDEGGGPQSIAAAGLSLWLAQGAWLTQVTFPQ